MFSTFNEKPCGAASLAQVHEATLKTGERVAVKIQHPKVQSRSFIDIATMEVSKIFIVRQNNFIFSFLHVLPVLFLQTLD